MRIILAILFLSPCTLNAGIARVEAGYGFARYDSSVEVESFGTGGTVNGSDVVGINAYGPIVAYGLQPYMSIEHHLGGRSDYMPVGLVSDIMSAGLLYEVPVGYTTLILTCGVSRFLDTYKLRIRSEDEWEVENDGWGGFCGAGLRNLFLNSIDTTLSYSIAMRDQFQQDGYTPGSRSLPYTLRGRKTERTLSLKVSVSLW